jgi:SPP1 family phage portal protein
MTESVPTVVTLDVKCLYGRKVLYTSLKGEQITKESIPDILIGVSDRHAFNIEQINRLLEQYLGKQEILKRERTFAIGDVNNKIVVNRAEEIVRKSVGYFLGEPISYTSRVAKEGEKQSGTIENLNAQMDEEDKAAKDIELGEWASICGTSYRLVMTTPDGMESDIPFKIATCDPRNTFVIYSSDVLERPMLAGVFSPKVDNYAKITGYDYLVYTDTMQYKYTTTNVAPMLGDFVFEEEKPLGMNEVPIVEYMNNQWRVGDYEKAMSLMDALNVSLSDRVNAIVQTVGSILVYVDCVPDEGGTEALKQKGAVSIKTGGSGSKTDIKFIAPELQQSDAQILEDTINSYIDAVTGIPSRSERSGGGGDTGDAVYLRDGYQDLELVVRRKERAFKRGERKTIRLIAQVMKQFGEPFDPSEVQVNFVRNRSTNIVNKATAISTLVATGVIAPVDAITIGGITDQPNELAARGEEHRKKIAAETQAIADKQNEMNVAAQKAEADKKEETNKTETAKTSEG